MELPIRSPIRLGRARTRCQGGLPDCQRRLDCCCTWVWMNMLASWQSGGIMGRSWCEGGPEGSRCSKEAMPSYIVEGGHSLNGTIRPAGNKNAALPAIAAAVLASEPVTLQNIPRIGDVETLLEIVAALGAEVSWDDENAVTIDAASVSSGSVDRALLPDRPTNAMPHRV